MVGTLASNRTSFSLTYMVLKCTLNAYTLVATARCARRVLHGHEVMAFRSQKVGLLALRRRAARAVLRAELSDIIPDPIPALDHTVITYPCPPAPAPIHCDLFIFHHPDSPSPSNLLLLSVTPIHESPSSVETRERY